MENPFRPGAGHAPPYLAGRVQEKESFGTLLKQRIVLKNLILTGLRGIGKTVLLESFRPVAHRAGWLWTGTDCSESASVNEQTMSVRMITDLALLTSSIKIGQREAKAIGFQPEAEVTDVFLDYRFLSKLYENTPGLTGDKLKNVLETVWGFIQPSGLRGIVFAYDEAQIMVDHAEDRQFPLSVLLDVFQSIQKKGLPFMLVLTGLPTLMTNLIEARTYSERLFQIVLLGKLNDSESRDAIMKPFEGNPAPPFNEDSIKLIVEASGGYPYFIQFICKEIYDIFLQQMDRGEKPTVPMTTITKKLDNDFFAARWARATDRERDLMTAIAHLNKGEFGIQEVEEYARDHVKKPFSGSQISQMLKRLTENGLIYKNRRGSYSFAVPLLEQYILRQALTEN